MWVCGWGLARRLALWSRGRWMGTRRVIRLGWRLVIARVVGPATGLAIGLSIGPTMGPSIGPVMGRAVVGYLVGGVWYPWWIRR